MATLRGDPILMPLINIHQLKAGGKTLENIFYREYRQSVCYLSKIPPKCEQIKVTAYPEKLKLMDKVQRNSIKLVTGHFFYGLHKEFDSDCRYITTLRKPASRLISYYYYLKESRELEISKVINDKLISLIDFVGLTSKDISRLEFSKSAAFELNFMLENGQSKFISGHNPGLGESRDNLFSYAIKNIANHFDFVGLTEKFDDSIIGFKRRLGWTSQLFYSKGNVTKTRPPIEDICNEVHQIINSRNSCDLSLYSWVESNFDNNLKKLLPDIAFQRKKLQFLNFMYSKYRKLFR